MAEKQNRVWISFHDLSSHMERMPRKAAPEDFTVNVMGKIFDKQKSAKSETGESEFPVKTNVFVQKTVSKEECAFYFFLTGFFYLVLGMTMMLGMPISLLMKSNSWLSFQPLLNIIFAVGLGGIGIFIDKGGTSTMKTVHKATWGYMILVIVNFGMGALYFKSIAAVLLVAIFSITALTLGALLVMAIYYYQRDMSFSEVHR